MLIDKDTDIYCSFSHTPGNNGCKFFNSKFRENNINAIYKSFYSDNIEDSIRAVKILDIKGFAVSMPFKVEILSHVDEISSPAKNIGAANTIVNNKGYLTAHNTDWIGVYNFLSNLTITDSLTILGNGGFSKATQYACTKLGLPFTIIKRDQWDLVPNLEGFIFNCTPAEVCPVGTLIDGRPFTPTGKKIARLQALEQYKIYINES